MDIYIYMVPPPKNLPFYICIGIYSILCRLLDIYNVYIYIYVYIYDMMYIYIYMYL